MSIININCVDQSLKIVNSPLITAGDENEDYVQFSFCSSWDGYAKIAIFYKNKAKLHYSIVGNDNRCTIPNSLLIDEGVLCIGVVGFKNDNGTYKTRTTEVLRYNIAEGALQGESIEDPTLAELFYKQVENAEINAEGHLIITLYDETELDAGAVRDSNKIKQLCDIVYDDEGNPADFVFKYTPQELFPDVNWETDAGAYEVMLNTIYIFMPNESMTAPLAYLTEINPDFENPENGTVSGFAFIVKENEIQTSTFGPVKKGESVSELMDENWKIIIPDNTEIDFSDVHSAGQVLAYNGDKRWYPITLPDKVQEIVNVQTNKYQVDKFTVQSNFNTTSTDKSSQLLYKFMHYPVINVTSENGKYYAYYINSTGLYKVELDSTGTTVKDSELIYEFKNVDLSNYYTKSETYTKAETDEKIATIDLSLYAKAADVNTELAKKQDKLTAGTDISISNNVISSTVDLTPYAKTTDLDTYATQTYVQEAIYGAMEASY